MGKQAATGTKKTKEAISKAAAASSKAGKKKWSKGKVKENLALAVFIDKETYAKAKTDVPKMKLITVSTVSDKMKVNGSMARRLIRHLAESNLIKKLDYHHTQYIFTGASSK